MFASSKLINTPLRGGVTVKKGHEFTPIGSKSRSALEPISHLDNQNQTERKGEKNYNRPLFRPLRDDAHDIRDPIMDSSFDQTTDNFNQSFSVFTKPQKDTHIDQNRGRNNNLLEENKLINNGMASIKEQEMRSRQLERENYNLKIKLATLQRFFEQSPEEQQELLSENISLKRQLVESIEEISHLKSSKGAHSEYDRDPSGTEEYELKLQDIRSEYNGMMAEKNQVIMECEHKIESLEDQLKGSNHSREKLDNYDLANQELSKMVDDLKHEIMELNIQNSDLNTSNQKLRLSNKALQSEVSEIENTKKQLQGNIEALKLDLARSNHELDIIENKHMADKDTMDEGRHRLNDLEKEVKYWKEEYESVRRNFGMKEHEIDDLKFQLKEYQQKVSLSRDTSNEYHYNLEKLSNESKTLNRRIESLEDIIKEKDKEEFHLREQISSLLKDKLSNNNSTFYEQEIESLKAKEKTLNDRIKSLMSDLDDLREHNFSSNNEKISKLQDQMFEQKNRIAYYEKEYEGLEREYANKKSELSQSENRLNESKRRIEILTDEVHLLESKLAGKSNNSALLELENISRKKLEEERTILEETNKRLNDELESMNYNIKSLQREIGIERSKARKDIYSDSDYEALVQRNKELQNTMKENEINYLRKIQEVSNSIGIHHTGINNINNNHYEIEYHKAILENNQLQNKLKELEITKMTEDSHKNMLIQNLEKRVCDMSSNVNDYDDEKTNLIRKGSEKDSKLRKMELDLENLNKDYQADISYYKNRISILEKKMKENLNKGEESIQLLLEMQLEDIKKSKNELTKKLNESISQNETLEDNINSLKEENKNYSQLVTKYEKQERTLKLDTNKLEIRNKSLVAEEKKLNSYIEKLVEKIKQLKNKEYSNGKVDLDFQLSKLSLNSRHRQETRLLSNELKYYKAKLYDINMKANDLQVMYSLITGCIKNSNDLIRTDIIKLKELGLYYDKRYSNDSSGYLRKKYGNAISFKVLAKFVLASVRMKNRYEKSTSRKLTLLELKNSIESDKIELIS